MSASGCGLYTSTMWRWLDMLPVATSTLLSMAMSAPAISARNCSADSASTTQYCEEGSKAEENV